MFSLLIQNKISELESLVDQDGLLPLETFELFYFLGNLSIEVVKQNNESAFGWRDDNYPEFLVRGINYYRQAYNIQDDQIDIARKEQAKTNIANQLSAQRRDLEALHLYDHNFSLDGDSAYVSTLRKAQVLHYLSQYVENENHAAFYQLEAFNLVKLLEDNIDGCTHKSIINTLQNDQDIVYLRTFGKQYGSSLEGWKNDHTPEYASKDGAD